MQREISKKLNAVKHCGSAAAVKRAGIMFQQFSV